MLPRLSSIGFPFVLLALIAGVSPTPAHAYLDPGTGSMILQLLLGGVAGLAVAGRFYWDRLLTLLRIRTPASEGGTRDDAASVNPEAK